MLQQARVKDRWMALPGLLLTKQDSLAYNMAFCRITPVSSEVAIHNKKHES
jgi:hypothetical protein